MKLRTLADINREIRLRSLVNLFWFCAVALPVLPQAPPSQDAFVRRTTPAINNRVGKTMIVSPGVTRQIPFKRPASVQQRTLNSSTSVASLYSDASSIFLEALTFPAGNLNRANAVTSADVNGDGRADLIVANQCLDLTCTAAGIALAFATGRVLESLLAGVQPGDPVTFAAAAVLSLAMAGAGSLLPAIRALRVDPTTAMRAE